MLWLAEKLSLSIGVVLLFTLLYGLFKGIPEAFDAVVTGNLGASPFLVLGFVLAGWGAGFIVGRTPEKVDGAMRLPQVIATAIFVAFVLWIQRNSLTSFRTFLDEVPTLLVSFSVWLMVVIAPWAASSTAGGADERDAT